MLPNLNQSPCPRVHRGGMSILDVIRAGLKVLPRFTIGDLAPRPVAVVILTPNEDGALCLPDGSIPRGLNRWSLKDLAESPMGALVLAPALG